MPNTVSAQLLQDQKQLSSLIALAQECIHESRKSELAACAHALQPADVPPTALRLMKLKKLVVDEEDLNARLTSLLNALGGTADAVFLLISSDGSDTDFYLGVRSAEAAPMNAALLDSTLKGQFPGTELEPLDSVESLNRLARLAAPGCSVASAALIPSPRRVNDSSYDSLRVQGLGRFVDSMHGQPYDALILAVPVAPEVIRARRRALESLSAALSPLEKVSLQVSESTGSSEQHALNTSIADGVTSGLTESYGHTVTDSRGRNRGSNSGWGSHGGFSFSFGGSNGSFTSRSVAEAITRAAQTGTSRVSTSGETLSMAVTRGASQSRTVTATNETVAQLRQAVGLQLNRLSVGESYGAFDACAFFVSSDPCAAQMAASAYRSLMVGDNTSAGVHQNIWLGFRDADAAKVLDFLRTAQMPAFEEDGVPVSAGMMVSGPELSQLVQLPRQSVVGLPVVEMASFGREVRCLSRPQGQEPCVQIGRIFHKGLTEQRDVLLRLSEFPSNLGVFGSVGVGKSTCNAMLINVLANYTDAKIMVIEPVKGEYKQLLRDVVKDLQVYTTNPLCCRMLRINPFEFPEGFPVLEHVENLMSALCAAWPLYAAQPALLRDCVLEAYLRTGWDLHNSMYLLPGPVRYPTFNTLLSIIPEVIAKSKFVGESKGTYEGALLSRAGMLTHGVFSEIFNGSACLSDRDLFEENVVVDLSSIASQETVALIMGVLIVRLKEYRTVNNPGFNGALRHLCVLEEAHRVFAAGAHATNDEGGQNAAGKTVEALSHCLAEMRGLNQGFIVSDQSPSLLDPSVIRNTATKVVFQLPEASDRQVIAQSLALTDQQADELFRLPARTALVYQRDWIEPVLCRMNKRSFQPSADVDRVTCDQMKALRGQLTPLILDMLDQRRFDAAPLCELIGRQRLNAGKTADLRALMEAFQRRLPTVDFEEVEELDAFFAQLLTELLGCEHLFRILPPPAHSQEEAVYRASCDRWRRRVVGALEHYAAGLTEEDRQRLMRALMFYDLTNQAVVRAHNALFGKREPLARR